MKKLPCSGAGCVETERWQTGEPRGQRMVEVEDNVEKGYCSITCALYDGALTLKGNKDEKATTT